MVAPGVRTLLAAVRSRLWWLQLGDAVRRAAWGTAGMALLAALVHAALRPVSVEALAWAAAVLWGANLAWATARRPTDAVCALWADRHLGGASAFTTWLEMAPAPAGADAAAVRWLGHWASERVPTSLRLLAQRPAPAHLFRPLLSMAACSALASLVLTLPQLASAPTPPASASAGSAALRGAEPIAALAQASAPAPQLSQIESALRAANADAEAEFRRGEGGRAPAAGTSRADDTAPTPVPEPGAAPPGQTPAGRASSADAPAASTRADATGQTAGASTGREAGDSPDLRADVGVSRAQGGTMPVQRSTSGLHHPSSGRRADREQQAQYDDEFPMRATAAGGEGPAAAAATPPAASDTTRLTPTETNYVQAWMKASGRR